MFRKGIPTVIVLFIFLFVTVNSSISFADWSSVSPAGITSTLSGVWGSASNDVYAVGTLGIKLHYDGNPDYTWEDQGKDSG